MRSRETKSEGPTASCSIRNGGGAPPRPLMGRLRHKAAQCSSPQVPGKGSLPQDSKMRPGEDRLRRTWPEGWQSITEILKRPEEKNEKSQWTGKKMNKKVKGEQPRVAMVSVILNPNLFLVLGTAYSWVTGWVWPQCCSWPPKTITTWDLFRGLGIVGLVFVSGGWPHNTLLGLMAQVYRNWALMTGSVSSQPDDSTNCS